MRIFVMQTIKRIKEFHVLKTKQPILFLAVLMALSVAAALVN